MADGANSWERLLDKMDDLAVDFNRKCNQISDMLTHIHNQSQIREETHLQPQIAAGVGTKNQSFSCSYDLQTPTLESPHLQPSTFVSQPSSIAEIREESLYSQPSPFISVSSIPKVIVNETDDKEEITTGMIEHKVFDEMPYSLCEGEMIKIDIAIGVDVLNEEDRIFNDDDGVLIKSRSIQAFTKHVALTSFSKVKVASNVEWKLYDKRPLRKIEFAVDRGKKRCLDDEDSSKMNVIKSQQVSSWLIEKVVVHPFVLLSIVDHYNQVACDTRNVVFDEFGYPKVVNDGVTVACAIELPNAMRNASATWIREVANTINYSAGDGTTTAFVLAHEIIKLGLFSVIFGEQRKALLQDVSILTGAEYQATDLGLLVEDTGIYQLGIARKVTITKDSTTIIVDAATKGELQARIAALKRELSETDFEKLSDRIAKLLGGGVVIKVGVATETDTSFTTVMVVVGGLIKDVQVKPDITHLRETICSINLSSRVRRVEHGPAWRETYHAEFLKYTQQTKQHERETKKLQDIVQALQFRLATREYTCVNIQVRHCDLKNQVAEGRKKIEIDPGGLDMNVIHLIVMANVGGCSIRSYYQNTVNCYEGWKMTNHGVEEHDVRDDPGDTTMIKCFEKNISDTIMICDLGGDSFCVLKFEVTRGQGDVTNETRIERQVLIESVCSVGRVEFVDKTFSRLFFMLLKQRKIVEAEVSIKRLFGKEKVAEIMGNLYSTSQGSPEPETEWLDLFSSRYRNVVSVATIVLVGAANVLGTTVSSSLKVKQGRKGLYLACLVGIATSMMFSLSISWTTLTLYSDTLVGLEIVLCVLSFSLGAGPVPTQPVPEIFASKIRAKAVVLFPRSNVDPWGQGSKIGGSNVMYTTMVNDDGSSTEESSRDIEFPLELIVESG